MNKMKLDQRKVGSLLSYIQIILGTVIAIVVTPFMLRFLGQSEYGIINLSASTVSYLNLITLGIGSAFIRFNVRYRTVKDVEGEQKLNGTFFVIYLIMSAIMVIAGSVLVACADLIFGNSLTAPELYKTKIIMGITIGDMAISLPFSVFAMNIDAYEKFIFGKSINIINTILNPLIKLPILFMGGLSISLTIGTTCLHLITCIMQYIYAKKNIGVKLKLGKPDKKLIKALFLFSIFIVINQIIDMINWNVDKLILGVVSGTVAVAIYGLGATFNTYVMQFSTAISNVLIPEVHKLVAKNAPMSELQKLFNKVGRIQFVLMALIMSGFVFFGKPFIVNFYADPSYEDAYYIAILLIIPLIVPLIQNVGIEIQRAMNKHQIRSIVYLCIAIANVGISIPLAKVYGGIGCAIGTCISLVVGNGIIMNLYYHFGLKLNMVDFWWQILKFVPALVIPLISGILIMLYVDLSNIGVFIGYVVLYIVIYGISMWLLGMNNYEKDLFRSPINKINKFIKDKHENRKLKKL